MPSRRRSAKSSRPDSTAPELKMPWGKARVSLQPDALRLDLLAGGTTPIASLRLYGELPSLAPEHLSDSDVTAGALALRGSSGFGDFAVQLAAAGDVARLAFRTRSSAKEIVHLRLQDHADATAARGAAFDAPDTLSLAPTADQPWAVAVRFTTELVPQELRREAYGVTLRFPEARETVLVLYLAALREPKTAAASRRLSAMLDAATAVQA